MSSNFPIPTYLLYCRHLLPGNMQPRHTNLTVALTPEQFKLWQQRECDCYFAADVLDPESEPNYSTTIGQEVINVLADAFDDWWIGHPDCIFDVGVYTLSEDVE